MAKHDEAHEAYSVGEMARMFGISRQTLIYYDRIGLFCPASSTPEGYRLYAPTQIPYLRLICLLKDFGLNLKVIGEIITSHDADKLTESLNDMRSDIDRRIAELERTRQLIDERARFYREAAFWQEREGAIVLRYYPERRVIWEPWDLDGVPMDRSKLHPALMKAAHKLQVACDMAPVAGWGTLLARHAFGTPDPFEGAGAFAVIPDGIDPAGIADVITLPAGSYVCQSRWGMPYDRVGADALSSWFTEHKLRPASDIYDFCLLDTTSYTEVHQEDFCCMQALIDL